MVVTKNYFTINKTLKSVLFTEQSIQKGQLEIIFKKSKGLDEGYFCLNYYNFNILL